LQRFEFASFQAFNANFSKERLVSSKFLQTFLWRFLAISIGYAKKKTFFDEGAFPNS
jgi:hypothetical protein